MGLLKTTKPLPPMVSYLWGASAKPEKKKENDNAEIAMREQLDESGIKV